MYATAEPTAFLLNALIPGAAAAVDADDKPTSHISDFRQQPRSDSRADKPDSFPGFDAAGEVRSPLLAAHTSASSASSSSSAASSASSSSSASALSASSSAAQQPQPPNRRPVRTEFYAQLVAKIIGNIGVDNIIGSVERKHDKLQRLRRLKQLKAHLIASAVHGQRATYAPQPSPESLETRLVDDDYADAADGDDGDDGDASDSGVVQFVAAAAQTAPAKSTAALLLSSTPQPPTPSTSTPSSLRDALHAFQIPAVLAIPVSYVSSLWTNYIRPNQLRNTFGLTDQSGSNRTGGSETQYSQPDVADAAHKNATVMTEQAATTAAVPTPAGGVRATGANASPNWFLSGPLRGIWHSATKNWYVNHPNPNMTLTLLHDTARMPDAAQGRPSHERRHDRRHGRRQHQQLQQQLRAPHELANDTGINVRHPNGMRNRQSTVMPSSIDGADTSTSTNIGTGSGIGISARMARAKLAFLHAFYKYSKHTSNGNYTGSNKNNDSISIAAARRHGQQFTATKTTAAALVRVADANASSADAAADAVDAAALPSATTTTTITTTHAADEFDANLNINDRVVAVGLAAERIAQLYGYRVPATATALDNHRAWAQATSATTATTASDTTNQHADDRQQRLRRVGEHFIALSGRGRRRSSSSSSRSSSVAAPRATDVGDAGDEGDAGDTGDAADDGDSNDNEHNESTGSTSSSGGDMTAGEIAESVGIFVLEILGTIAGLGWGAFTYLQGLLYT